MIIAECSRCRDRQTAKNQECRACGVSFSKVKPVYWTKVCYQKYDGKYAYKCSRWAGLTLKEAHAKEIIEKNQVDIYPRSKGVRLAKVFNDYLEYLKIQSPAWAIFSDKMLHEMLEYFRNPGVMDLTRNMVMEFQVYLRTRPKERGGKPLSPDTINRYLAVGKAAFNRYDPDAPNPFKRVKALAVNKMIEYLTPDEEDRLINAAKDYSPLMFQLVVFSLATGLRKSEVLNLKRTEVDFCCGTLRLVGKGGRVINKILTPTAKMVLEGIADNGTEYFWVCPTTGKPYVDMKNGFRQCLKRVGITRRFRWHGLRHQTVHKLMASGNVEAVRDFMQHSSIQTTLRYFDMPSESQRAIAGFLDIPQVLEEKGKMRIVK